jgi:hypothetical protein
MLRGYKGRLAGEINQIGEGSAGNRERDLEKRLE